MTIKIGGLFWLLSSRGLCCLCTEGFPTLLKAGKRLPLYTLNPWTCQPWGALKEQVRLSGLEWTDIKQKSHHPNHMLPRYWSGPLIQEICPLHEMRVRCHNPNLLVGRELARNKTLVEWEAFADCPLWLGLVLDSKALRIEKTLSHFQEVPSLEGETNNKPTVKVRKAESHDRGKSTEGESPGDSNFLSRCKGIS